MKITEFAHQPELDEVRMDPTSFAQAVEQGHAAGVLVGFEFEVCIPEATVKGKSAEEPGEKPAYTTDQTDDSLYQNNVWDEKIGGRQADIDMTPEWFDSVFKFKQPLKGFDTASAAYPAFKDNILPGVIELYNKLTPKQQKKYSDLAVKRIRADDDRSFSFASKKLSDQLKFARMVGYLLYIKNSNNELEHLGVRMRSMAAAGTSWKGFLIWLTGNGRVDVHTSQYFTYDPSTVWDQLRLTDYESDDYYDDEDDGGSYEDAAAVLQPAVTTAMESTVQVFHSYHQKTKNLTDWYIEPDGSLSPNNEEDSAAEIVSPPLPALDAMTALNRFYGLAQQMGLYTNDSTGLHINVSIPQKLDVLKLAVFLGDEYVLKYFGREGNDYARSVFRDLSGGNWENDVKVKKKKTDVFGRPAQTTTIDIKTLADFANNVSRAHTASISNNGKYISFRHAGGNYLADLQGIKNAVGRFVRAMIIASDPAAYVQEYRTKLAKITQDQRPVNPADSSALVNYLRTKGSPVLNVGLAAFDSKMTTALNYYLSERRLKQTDVKIVPVAVGDVVKQEFAAKVKTGLAGMRIDRTIGGRFATYQIVPVTIAGLKAVNAANSNGSVNTIENKEWNDIAYSMETKSNLPASDPTVQHLLKQVLRALYKK